MAWKIDVQTDELKMSPSHNVLSNHRKKKKKKNLDFNVRVLCPANLSLPGIKKNNIKNRYRHEKS